MYPSFVFAKCCWSIHSKGLARTRTANREKPLPYKLRSFTSSSYTYPASSTSIWCIFSIYGLVWSNIGNSLDAEKQKNWFKYTDFTELKKITGRINSNTSNFSSLFFKSIKLVAVRFVWLKNNLQLTVQVCCLFYFLLHRTFFKGKEKNRIFGGFYCFVFLQRCNMCRKNSTDCERGQLSFLREMKFQLMR